YFGPPGGPEVSRITSRRAPRLAAGGGSGAAEQVEQRGTVRRAEAGAGVPAGAGLVRAVVALDDVVEPGGGGTRGGARVQHRLEQAEALAGRLGQPRDEPGPQRRDRGRAAVCLLLSVHDHGVSGQRVGVAG